MAVSSQPLGSLIAVAVRDSFGKLRHSEPARRTALAASRPKNSAISSAFAYNL